jgi:hypothetical protein
VPAGPVAPPLGAWSARARVMLSSWPKAASTLARFARETCRDGAEQGPAYSEVETARKRRGRAVAYVRRRLLNRFKGLPELWRCCGATRPIHASICSQAGARRPGLRRTTRCAQSRIAHRARPLRARHRRMRRSGERLPTEHAAASWRGAQRVSACLADEELRAPERHRRGPDEQLREPTRSAKIIFACFASTKRLKFVTFLCL